MRFYIVGNDGNEWGNFGDLKTAEMALGNYSEKDIETYELEIIEADI